eukprot:COSAG01_NODE_5433_length_4265_cov_9.667067_1_plen_294_part_10
MVWAYCEHQTAQRREASRQRQAQEQRRREAEAAERTRRERALTAELGMWQFYAAGAGIEPPLRLGYSVAERFAVGERVRRRDHGEAWGTGYVTSTAPLRVSFDEDDGRNGYHWDEVQKLTASVSGQSMSALYSAASASASEPRLWAAYHFTRGSLAQRYEQAAERRREEEQRIDFITAALRRKAADAAKRDNHRAEQFCMTKCYMRSSVVVPHVCLDEPLLWLDYGSSSQCNALRAVESLSAVLPRVVEEWHEVAHLVASQVHKQGAQIELPTQGATVLQVAAALLQADNDVSD